MPDGKCGRTQTGHQLSKSLVRLFPGAATAILTDDFSARAGEAAAAEILSRKVPCDAICAANDMMAIGCLQHLRTAGINIPGQIAVAGFDDISLAQHLELTTNRVQIAKPGERTVTRVSDIVEGKDANQRAELHPTEWVIRGSSAPALKVQDGVTAYSAASAA